MSTQDNGNQDVAGGIFVSYSHHDDRQEISQIVETIRQSSGRNVWYDPRLRGGQKYFAVIAGEILARAYFVFIVSAHSVVSEWCLNELEFAASKNKTIIAIYLEPIDTPPRVQLVINNTIFIEWHRQTQEEFALEIADAFDDSVERDRQRHSDEEMDLRSDLDGTKRYYLSMAERKRIKELLSLERNNRFSVCFEAENAWMLGIAYELGVHTEADPKRAGFYYRVSDYNGSYEGKYLYAAIRLRNLERDSAAQDKASQDSASNETAPAAAPQEVAPVSGAGASPDPQEESQDSQGGSQDTTAAQADPAAIEALREEMMDAAAHGSIYALTYIGDDYYYGRNGLARDVDTARTYWRQAAEHGGVVAMYYLAWLYYFGRDNIDEDLQLAYMYTLMAMEYEFPRAYRLLGRMYTYGDYLQGDSDQAVAMFDEAVRHGDYMSLCYAGDVYDNREEYDRSRAYYERALQYARDGRIRSGEPFYDMGHMYKFGHGVNADAVQASEYYLEAAARNHKTSLRYATDTIMRIEDVDVRESYLHRAYALGCAYAALELGELEESRGDGKEMPEAARRYYIDGAERGDLACVRKLFCYYSHIVNSDHADRDEAIKWLQFYFAHMTDEEHEEQAGRMGFYYFLYAMELDRYGMDEPDPDARPEGDTGHRPGQDYFRKALDLSPEFLPDIVSSVQFRLTMDLKCGSNRGLRYAESMLPMCEQYIEAYRRYQITNHRDTADASCAKLIRTFTGSYRRLAMLYKSGVHGLIARDTAVARKYVQMAAAVSDRMAAIIRAEQTEQDTSVSGDGVES